MDFKISYECSELIEEIEEDIAEFGADFPAFAIWEKKLFRIPFTDKANTVDILVDYEMEDEEPYELFDGETAVLSTLGEIHAILVKQNKI